VGRLLAKHVAGTAIKTDRLGAYHRDIDIGVEQTGIKEESGRQLSLLYLLNKTPARLVIALQTPPARNYSVLRDQVIR
jgi:hypothetical protein